MTRTSRSLLPQAATMATMAFLLLCSVAMVNSVAPQPEPPTEPPLGPVYTFLHPHGGESWIQYNPTWPRTTQEPRLEFSFRTKRANAFVFSMHFDPRAQEDLELGQRALDQPAEGTEVKVTLWGRLKKGEFRVTLSVGGQDLTVKAGKGECSFT